MPPTVDGCQGRPVRVAMRRVLIAHTAVNAGMGFAISWLETRAEERLPPDEAKSFLAQELLAIFVGPNRGPASRRGR
jgi:hypothetical protein